MRAPDAGALLFCRVACLNQATAEMYARVAELPLEVQGYTLERLEAGVTRNLERVTTLVRLAGAGEEGLGEDGTWDTAAHECRQGARAPGPPAGSLAARAFSSGSPGRRA